MQIIFQAAYVAVMRRTTGESKTGLESLLSFYKSTDVLQERERILRMTLAFKLNAIYGIP